MSEKARLSFLFSFNKRKNFTVILAAICVLGAVVTYIAGNVIREKQGSKYETDHTPVLNVDGWFKDLTLFHDKTGAYPKDIADLELVIWNKGDKSKASVLSNGNSLYLFDNYLYLYNVDTTKTDKQICSIWAVPTGAFKEKANTYFIIITPKSKQTWKGAALVSDEFKHIPMRAVPLDTEMARLGMSLQLPENDSADKPKQTLFQWGKK